jgi:large subunit ribosomal protein L4
MMPTTQHTNPNVAEHLYNVPKVLTTIHAWPSMEPSRYAWFDSQHLDMPLRKDLLHRAVIYEADSHRLGTASTKWRNDVHGSGRKIQKQKGTGNARVGDKKSPIRKGGGVAHGPHPRDFSTDLPRKVYDKAWRTALSYRYRKGELLLVDGEMVMDVTQTPHFLLDWFKSNEFGKGFGRSLLVTKNKLPKDAHEKEHLAEQVAMAQAMSAVGEHGLMKDVFDVDVKDLLETGRIIMEENVLRALLLAHSSDLGSALSLRHAVDEVLFPAALP